MQNYDLILTPTMAAPPPPIGLLSLDRPPQQFGQDILSYATLTSLFNISGQPAMSVPLYWNQQQLPIGVMFAAPIGGEATLFRLAGVLEKARPWWNRTAPDFS